MTKIQRTTQKTFAGQAGSQQITAFGTAKDQTPIYTQDLSQIQNTNYLYGWSAGLLPDKAPWQEDMNALFFVVTRQLEYLFQEGIPEYDIGTSYNKGALAKFIDSQGNVTIYKSLSDNNTGNPLEDGNYWAAYQTEGVLASYEIGLPQPTFSNTLLANEIWLEGQTVSRTIYKNLFAIYGETYGAGDGSTTFKLPDCRNRVLWGSETFGYIDAGLPNITGSINYVPSEGTINANGAFNAVNAGGDGVDGTKGRFWNISFDASRSSAVYKNSIKTVQPPAIGCRIKTRFK